MTLLQQTQVKLLMKDTGGSQPWCNPQKLLSDKVVNHSPACPDSELECLGGMQIRNQKKSKKSSPIPEKKGLT